MSLVHKVFNSRSKAVNAEAGIFEAMISTETIDRQGDIVRATGAVLDNYMKNPVVLWDHNYHERPVAKALNVEILPGRGLKSTFQFPARGISRRIDEIRDLWQEGFLNAVSIGFIPLASRPINPNDKWGSQEYTRWELLEYSICPVPANQEALRLAIKRLKGRSGRQSGNLDPVVAHMLMAYLELLKRQLKRR